MLPTRTVSSCTPRTVQGIHVFSISGYSQHRGIGYTEYNKSGAFSVGGHEWEIRFYPDGQHKQDFIAVYLELLSKGANVHASCDLRLVDQTTGLSSSVHKTAPRMFNPNNDLRFAPQDGNFMSRTEFEASAYLRNDHLAIECVVTVLKDAIVSQVKPRSRIEVPPSDITAQLGKLLEAQEEVDVTFSVGGETFAAHKIILAMRSPVFKAEFYGPMRENAAALIIPIQDMQPDVFKAMLHFIYTDALPAMDDLEGDDRSEIIRHLLVAADRYALDRLKLVCQSILCDNIDVQTVATTLALADQHHCDMLKDACVEFISSSAMDDIVATKGFVDLTRNCPSVLIDVFVRMSRSCKS